MKKPLLSFLSAMALFAGVQATASAQTTVDASNVLKFEYLNNGDGAVSKSGNSVVMNGEWKMFGYYNEWQTVDLSEYSKLNVVLTDYQGSAKYNSSMSLILNLCLSADTYEGTNVSTQASIKKVNGKEVNSTVELEFDLEELTPYRAKVYYVVLMNSESCSFNVKDFYLTKKSNALPQIDGSATVVETSYLSLTGIRSKTPNKGLNIIRQTMSDGSVRTTKALF